MSITPSIQPDPIVDNQIQDMLAIRQIVADAEQFQNDPEKFSQLLAPNVFLINVAGIRLIGRDVVYQAMTSAMKTPLANIITKNEVEHITFLRPDVALVSGIKRISQPSETDQAEESQARLTFILVKNQENWLIAFVQNTPIQ